MAERGGGRGRKIFYIKKSNGHFSNLFPGHKNCLFLTAVIPGDNFELLFGVHLSNFERFPYATLSHTIFQVTRQIDNLVFS